MVVNIFAVLFKYLLPLITWIFFYLSSKRRFKLPYLEWFGLFFLISVTGLRYGYGRDYFSYSVIFSSLEENSFIYFIYEPLSQFLFSFSAKIGFGFNFFLCILSLFYIFSIYFSVIKKTASKHRHFGMAVFFLIGSIYFGSLGVVRQYIAVSIVVLAYGFFYRSNRPFFYFLLVVSVGFHFSAIFVLLVSILNIKIDSRNFVMFFLGLMLVLLFDDLIVPSLDFLISFTGIPISAKYFVISSRVSLFHLVYYSWVLIQIYFILNFKKALRNERYLIYFDLVLIGLCVELSTIVGLNSLSRLLPYFLVFYPYVLVRMFECGYGPAKFILFLMLLVFISFEIKNYYGPAEFSYYTSQYRLLPFYDAFDYRNDLNNYWREEKALHTIYRKVEDD